MEYSRSSKQRRGSLRTLFAVFAIAALSGGAVLLGIRLDNSRVPQQRRSIISLLVDGQFSARFSGEMIAEKMGFLGTIRIQQIADKPNFVEIVAREPAIGVTTGQKFLLAAWRGVPVTAFAASFLESPIAVYSRKASEIRYPVDLVGKRVGYRANDEGEVIFDAMLAQLGLPRSQIKKELVGDPFEALRSGKVEAVLARVDEQPQPGTPNYVEVNILKPQDYAIHIPGVVYFASSDLVQSSPSLVANTLDGIIRGWKFAYADYTRSVPIVVGFDPERLSPHRIEFELEQQRGLIIPVGGRIAEYEESRWRTLRDILVFAKLGEEAAPLSRVVDFGILRNVYRRTPEGGVMGRESGR